MTFYEVLAQVLDLLQREGRVTYRALERQFGLDDEFLDDLKAEIIDAKRLAVDEDGRVLVWIGGPAPAAGHQERAPASYTPPHLVEKILTLRSALEGERKPVTVLSCDLANSTTLAERLGPEAMHTLPWGGCTPRPDDPRWPARRIVLLAQSSTESRPACATQGYARVSRTHRCCGGFMKEEYMAERPFLTDIQALRARARQHIEQGAVTQGYRANRETVIRLLNEALATEIVCVLRYKRHYFMASGINAQSVAQEFLQHANDEQLHADQIAQRIVQLGGEPNLSPDGLLTRSHSEYVEGTSLVDMIKEDLVAERIAIDSYRDMIAYFGNDDPTTRRLMEGILAMEEEHADDLVSLLEELGP